MRCSRTRHGPPSRSWLFAVLQAEPFARELAATRGFKSTALVTRFTNLKGFSDSLSSPATGEGGNHGCEGDFGKEVCREAELKR
jgi:hypothetical protein